MHKEMCIDFGWGDNMAQSMDEVIKKIACMIRLDLKLPLISVIDKLTERVQAYSKIENIQVGLFRLEVEDFPERVFQEAVKHERFT